MKFLYFVLPICLLSFLANHAQDRKKELDSLILHSQSLPEDTLKAKVLSRIHERMMFMDAEKAFDYAKQAFELSNKIGYERGVANGYLQFGNYYYNQSKNDSASYFHRKALNELKAINSIRGQIFALHSLASIEREKGDYALAIELTQSILDMYTDENRQHSDLGDFDLRGSEYEVLGGIYSEKGNYTIALKYTLKALRFFEDINDEVRAADALKQLSDIEYQQENYDSSLEYAKKAIAIYKKNDDKIYMSHALNSAGLSAEKLQQNDEAKAYFEESLALAKEMNAQAIISRSLIDLARLKYMDGDFSEARALLTESIAISKKEDIKLDLTEALYETALLDIKEGKYSQSLQNLDQVMSISKQIGTQPLLSKALKARAQVKNLLGNATGALADYQAFQVLHDTIYNTKKSQQIEELKTIYETEKKEAEIALQKEEINTLNEKAKVDKLTKGLYAGGMFTFVAVSGLLFFGFRQRMKKNRIEREKQEEIYKKEIEHKQKELASQTLHLVQKNTFLEELKENLENLKNSPDKFKMEFRRIAMLLKKEKATDRDWETFKTYFSEVHNDFDQKLKTLYPEISEKEVRLAAFLRMNLTTKEIAATMNVLPNSILKSKYRLKKKLGLDKDQDLNKLLNTL